MDDTHDVSESFPRILNPGKKNSSVETEFSRVIDFLQLIAFVPHANLVLGACVMMASSFAT